MAVAAGVGVSEFGVAVETALGVLGSGDCFGPGVAEVVAAAPAGVPPGVESGFGVGSPFIKSVFSVLGAPAL